MLAQTVLEGAAMDAQFKVALLGLRFEGVPDRVFKIVVHPLPAGPIQGGTLNPGGGATIGDCGVSACCIVSTARCEALVKAIVARWRHRCGCCTGILMNDLPSFWIPTIRKAAASNPTGC
jgi:hypothetical protein